MHICIDKTRATRGFLVPLLKLLAVWACCATTSFGLQLDLNAAEEMLLIVSTGGVGTTEFMEEVEAASNEAHSTLRDSTLITNDVNDTDGLKHRPFPVLAARRDIISKVKKILYVHGPLLHSMLSLERRDYLADQLNKVRTDGPHLPADWRHRKIVKNQVPTTLKAYTSLDEDYGQFAKHYAGYLNQCNFSVAFLDLTRKTDNLERLAAFLKLPTSILQKHLTPWRGDAVISSRIAGTSGKLALQFKGYEEKPTTYHVDSEVKAKLDKWLLPVEQQLQELGGLHIQEATCASTNKLL